MMLELFIKKPVFRHLCFVFLTTLAVCLVGSFFYRKFDLKKYDCETVGTVVRSKVKTKGAGRGAAFFPVVKYKYEVGGKIYENDRYSFWDENGSEEWANEIVSEYPAGTACSVYYISNNPKKSVITIAPGSPSIVLFWISVGILAISLLSWTGWIFYLPTIKKLHGFVDEQEA